MPMNNTSPFSTPWQPLSSSPPAYERLALMSMIWRTVLTGRASVPAGKALRRRSATTSSTSSVPSRQVRLIRNPKSSTDESDPSLSARSSAMPSIFSPTSFIAVSSTFSAEVLCAAAAAGSGSACGRRVWSGESESESEAKSSASSTAMRPRRVASLLRSGRLGSNLNWRARSPSPGRACSAGSILPGSIWGRKETKKSFACG
mmetsp:Transcript_32846/g.77391  ORF Transcript_32846/g.77391 Transcript_32846/m.77391 type:complete len:203 (-) Transcript_32846:305-913(-)